MTSKNSPFLSLLLLLLFISFVESATLSDLSMEFDDDSQSSLDTILSMTPSSSSLSLNSILIAPNNGIELLNSSSLPLNDQHFLSKRQASSSTSSSSPEGLDILPPNYYRNVAPTQNDKPVLVDVSVIILNLKIGSISTQDYEVDAFCHFEWTDFRLKQPTNVDAIAHMKNHTGGINTIQYQLPYSWRNRLWIPDVYFRNAVSGSISNIFTPTYYFIVRNYTQIFLAVRMNLKLTCHMNFYKFPFDTQTCYMNLTSTSEDYNTMRLKWKIFRIGSHVDESEFSVVEVDKESKCSKRFDFGTLSCLYGKIVFKRNVGKYLIKRIIPSFIIVMITFIGFWIPTNISPARTALPITALLALITQQIQSDLNVSYVYALQVWNIVCIVFVFANLLEFAIALYWIHCSEKLKKRLAEQQKKNDEIQMQQQPKTLLSNENLNLNNHNQNQIHRQSQSNKSNSSSNKSNMNFDDANQELSSWPTIKRKWSQHFQTTTRHSSIDRVCRYLFPLLYALFIFAFAYFVISD